MSNLTIKQEKFAKKYIELGNATEAYRQSYDADNMSQEAIAVEACRLLDNPNVALRVEELKNKAAKRHDVTVDSLSAEYEEIRMLASAKEQFAPAVSAITGKAKLHGLLIDKQETKVTLENATDEQLDRILADAASKAGISIGYAGKGEEETAE